MTENQPPAKVRYVVIDRDREGQRLDNYLFAELRRVPKSRIYKMLRSGEVRVNKKRARQGYRLVCGDSVRIPPVRLPAEQAPVLAGAGLRQSLEQAVLFEDEDLLVINKPSGLAVHGGSGIHLGVIETVRQMRPDCRRLELVHRLDRDTSGCLMMAKNRASLLSLHEQLQNKSLRKHYLALVQGHWPANLSRMDAPLLKNELSSGERIVKVSAQGRRATTLFKCQQRFVVPAIEQGLSLVQASPVSGRTHQIRVHCQYAGHPIGGDAKYAPADFNKALAAMGMRRLFLHAEALQFELKGRPIKLQAGLETKLSKFLDSIHK